MPADLNDPYGIDLRLSPTGDLQVDPGGALADITGTDNCAQALVSRLNTMPGELPLHEDYGSTLMTDTIGTKLDVTLAQIRAGAEARRLLALDRRFLTVVTAAAFGDQASPVTVGVRIALRLASGEILDLAARDVEVDLADISQRTDVSAQDLDDLGNALVLDEDDDEDDLTVVDVEDLIEFGTGL